MRNHNQRTKARLNERIRAILFDGPMRSDEIHSILYREYGHEKWNGLGSVATMSQTMRQSGMFRRSHWVDTQGNTHNGKMSSSELRKVGVLVNIVSVWENKSMDEIIEPFLTKTHTRRRIERMPATVREAYNLAKGDEQ